ncbi:cytochrome c3 family protein [Geothrix fuzhouensis]|uniref:cytochrome c3 family protein n=1 Tax=Geothrix fuzhouensis TaxID=2966451 RepID=UPI00214830E5|nr:cytochrome c3 family protein [Geothrix fuzhouensis]
MRICLRALAIVLAPTLLLALPPATGVDGTAHDLSITGLNSVTLATRSCVFCHTVHNSGGGSSSKLIPDWNHTTTVAAFAMYNNTNHTGADLKGTVDSQPTGPSLACLSCHDGSVAVGSLLVAPLGGGNDTYISAKGGVSPGTGRISSGSALVGTDLSNDHPISITYQDNLDTGLQPAASLVAVRLYPENVTGAKVQCSSCHDAHNYGTPGTTAPFLRATMEGSFLCRSCHKK